MGFMPLPQGSHATILVASEVVSAKNCSNVLMYGVNQYALGVMVVGMLGQSVPEARQMEARMIGNTVADKN